jgi:hypothetical protein
VKKLFAAAFLVLFLSGFGYFVDVEYIPVNIDGGQGMVVYEFVPPHGVTYVSLLLYSMDVPGVNIGIRGGEHFYAMHLPEWHRIEFNVAAGSPVEIIMSTNHPYPGAVELFFQPEGFDTEAVATRAIELIKDLLEYLDDFNGPLRYADLWEPILPTLFEPADGPGLNFSLVQYCCDFGMLCLGAADLLPLIDEDTVRHYAQEGMGMDGFGVMLAHDMLAWLADAHAARFPHLWEPLLTTNWTIAQPLTPRASTESYDEPIFAQARSAAGSKKLCEAGFRRLRILPWGEKKCLNSAK